MTIRSLLVVVSLLALAAPVSAQRRIERFAPPLATSPDTSLERGRSTAWLAAGGVVGGAALGGLLGGATYLAACDREPSDISAGDETCAVIAGLAGTVGLIIGVPLGVHVANRGAGSVGADLVASLGGAVVGAGAVLLSGTGAALALVPIVQLVAVIMTERATAAPDDF